MFVSYCMNKHLYIRNSRELCQRSEVGCYFGCCKNKNTCCGKFVDVIKNVQE